MDTAARRELITCGQAVADTDDRLIRGRYTGIDVRPVVRHACLEDDPSNIRQRSDRDPAESIAIHQRSDGDSSGLRYGCVSDPSNSCLDPYSSYIRQLSIVSHGDPTVWCRGGPLICRSCFFYSLERDGKRAEEMSSTEKGREQKKEE